MKVNPKLQWRAQGIIEARIMGCLMRKAIGVARRKPKRKATCTAGGMLGGTGDVEGHQSPDNSVTSPRCATWNCSGVCVDAFDLLQYHSST